jgi:hypothetical protein
MFGGFWWLNSPLAAFREEGSRSSDVWVFALHRPGYGGTSVEFDDVANVYLQTTLI